MQPGLFVLSVAGMLIIDDGTNQGDMHKGLRGLAQPSTGTGITFFSGIIFHQVVAIGVVSFRGSLLLYAVHKCL